MALGSINSAFPNGRPSGLPENIVDQLVNARKQRDMTPLQSQIQEAKQQKDVYTQLNTKLVDIMKSADQFNSTNDFNAYNASSSDTSVATAQASSDAQEGHYNLDVTNLAQAQNKLVGEDDGSIDGNVTQGVTDPDDAAQINNTTFSFDHQGTTYDFDTTDKSLNQIVDDINNSDAAVQAQSIDLGNGEYALGLKSQTTGKGENLISNISGDIFEGGNTGLEEEIAQVGKDASFSVDGVDYTRSSNSVSDVIPGTTLNLQGIGPSNVDVSLDTSSITSQVQGFVDTFNSLDSFLDEKASYNKETDEAGPLLGDATARTAKTHLRSIINSPVEGTEGNEYQFLSQVGIEFENDGSISLDQEQFENALQSNYQDVQSLFTGDKGAAGKIKSFLGDYTSSTDGVIPNQIDSKNDKIDDLNEEVSETQKDLQSYRERLVNKYTELEKAMLEYNNLEEQLSRAIDTWDNSDS